MWDYHNNDVPLKKLIPGKDGKTPGSKLEADVTSGSNKAEEYKILDINIQ